ncbi:EAL domain-containing protein [Bacillus sp. 1P10SD]|uniref:sensor domain-containing protein n=1 Tax=Bacillus sp. 1P10SD TaxID=3132265 RepID=UPI0039A713E0
MGFKGRIIAILFIGFCRLIFIFLDLTQHDVISPFEICFTILLFIPMYFFGLQYDKARYYSKEVKDIFENGHIMLWKWERKTNSARVSTGCEQIYGYSSKEFNNDGLLWIKVVYEKDKTIAEGFQKETLKGRVYSSQYRIVHKSGKVKWVQNMANPVFDKNGKFIKINGVTIDITKQKEKDMNYRKLIDTSPVANIIIKDEVILYVNNEAMRLIGANKLNDVIGKKIQTFLSDEQKNLSNHRLKQLFSGEVDKLPFYEYKVQKLNGMIIDVESSAIKTSYNDEEAILVVGKDITEEKKAQNELKKVLKELQDMAFYDSLTGLLNRNSLNKYIEAQLKVLNPNIDTLSILFIDFDRFKNINDTLGHKYGDIMLQKAAEILIECVNNKEQVFRYGGDEFVIVLNQTTSKAEIISQKIIDRFSDTLLINGVEVFTTPSIGISLYPSDGKNAEELMKAADIAMYFAKESGKNTYKFFNRAIGERTNKSIVIERELRKALKDNQLILYLQPKIHLFTNQIIGYESLIRWDHPELGMVSPSEFIPIAEETGMIVKLGEWVLQQACQKALELSKFKDKEIPIAINISVKQFADSNFVKNSKEIIEKTRCKPSLLEFEITETVMQDMFSSIKIVKELKAMGLKISMDDFGTGYSNLSILSEMDIDILKIDRSFVKRMNENSKSLSLVKTIINMGHSLGFEIVAEGIETLEQLELLKNLNCDIGQGFYFSPAVTIEEIIK